MFNLSASSNGRCNGVTMGSSSVARPLANRTQRTSATISTSSTDHKSKITEQSKFNIDSTNDEIDGIITVKLESSEDPYTFSESESTFKQNYAAMSHDRKLIVNSKYNHLVQNVVKNGSRNISSGIKNQRVTVRNNLFVNETLDSRQSDNWKTINRLQTQIARNKLTVKHSKDTPEQKEIGKSKLSSLLREGSLTKNESDTKSSIIGVGDFTGNLNRQLAASSGHTTANNFVRKPPAGKPTLICPKSKCTNDTYHEVLQRIRKQKSWHAPGEFGSLSDALGLSDSDSDETYNLDTCRHRWTETMSPEDVRLNREARIRRAIIRLKRIWAQRRNSNSEQVPKMPALIADAASVHCDQVSNLLMKRHALYKDLSHRLGNSSSGVLSSRKCTHKDDKSGIICRQPALPCTRHCTHHIMHNTDQLLFDYCTAKFADNTQCCIPVFDLTHELPLCTEHARKRDNYNRMCQETKPKKPRKKVKPSAMIRPQKRNKKRKRPPLKSNEKIIKSDTPVPKPLNENSDLHIETSSACESSEEIGLGSINETPDLTQPHFGPEEESDVDMVAQVLGVGGVEELPLELSGPAEALVQQASRLLEESDFTTVLNQIPPDAFNDLFTIDRNGSYEPTREETEELERALEAVDQDVKSLEKMSQTQGLLDSLLDEHALVESLAQMPDVFHNLNGFSISTGVSAQSASSVTGTSASLPVPRPVNVLESIVQQPQAHTPS